MNWKQLTGIMTVAGAALGSAYGGGVTQNYDYATGFANGGNIPDYDLTGWQDTRTVNNWVGPWSITDVKVTLTIADGYNGDLYASLLHDTGFSVLLNRVGRSSTDGYGSDRPGFFGLELSSSAVTDVHLSGDGTTPLTGSWQPDGRELDPLGPAAGFDSAARTALLSSFDNLNPNGTWTLFIADVSPNSMSQMTKWSLGITAVPEPAVGLVLSGSGLVAGLGWLALRRRKAK